VLPLLFSSVGRFEPSPLGANIGLADVMMTGLVWDNTSVGLRT
jgi:hypothetical protein